MPTYEYKCVVCDYHWEIDQKITDEPIKECPKCKCDKAVRLIAGGTNFILLGGGWCSDGYSKSS
jgi:putative FmdB family regulatory protein